VFEQIVSGRPDLSLEVERAATAAGLEITFQVKSERPCLLHWGLAGQRTGSWQAPPESLWPAGTRAFGGGAVQTPLVEHNAERRVVLRLGDKLKASFLVFDLCFPESNSWDNNHGKDYYLSLSELKPSAPPLAEMLENEIKGAEVLDRNVLPLDSGENLVVAITRTGGHRRVLLLTDARGPLALHWGVTEHSRSEWQRPPLELCPVGSSVSDERAVDTPFTEWQQGCRLVLDFPEAQAPPGLSFVLHQTGTGRWLKHGGQNFYLRLAKAQSADAELGALAERIVNAETGSHGWTLMHRFNLCYELVDAVHGQRDGWGILFVWLRFSVIRQLDWQRNYNTKPRELSHAQDRLTLKLAEAYIHEPPQRDLIRQVLGCLGRGGEGQRIRDEILQIMHRHHIKEVGGTWMEQWHQKLHNNTTPDDIIICEAYLAFLRGNGDLNSYFETLAANGVTRERLARFERPITRDPEWHPHLKDALLHDFENFLKLLKSVHSGIDLDTAANAAGSLLDAAAGEALGYVRHHFGNLATPPTVLVEKLTLLRCSLHSVMNRETNAGRVRDGLYLDLALEEALRVVIERAVHSDFTGEQLVRLTGHILDNLLLTDDDAERFQCRKEWQRIPAQGPVSVDWALHAKAALDRVRRAIAATIDRCYQELQPKAEQLGRAFHAEEWAIKLFSEAVVRGRPAFVLSLLIRHLDSILRQGARLGDWQVINPSHATGEVVVVESLRAIQGRRFERPAIILAEKVFGDEEPPEGVRAVITLDSVDLVSHVAVRARNAQLLFATCYDSACFDRLQALKGRLVRLEVNAAGDVLCREAQESPDPVQPSSTAPASRVAPPPRPVVRPLRRQEFEPDVVGGKSCHLKELADKLPDWIDVPRSVAVPFAVFDSVLALDQNRGLAERYRKLLGQIESNPATVLAEIRRLLLDLQLPESLRAGLRQAMQAEGLPWPEDWPAAAQRMRQVWASKWNDRAYYSRRARGLPHDSMFMAVLIQEVVEAEYAFVIHTVNPVNGKRGELYAEVVAGLGETLVGNYPGRAMSFVSPKAAPRPAVLAYPSKSVGLYGGGLIFRSDSNAEDLEGYAGAGLYDSVLLVPARERILDYTSDALVWNAERRAEFLTAVTRLGVSVEQAFGAPQDIEGAWTRGRFYVVQTRPQVGLKI